MAFDNNIKREHALRIAVGIIILALLFAGSAGAATTHTVCPNTGICDFTGIQEAINASNPGDTIEVNSGIYSENMNITKQLILRGIGNPVVNGVEDGKIVTLAADGIILDGFTVKGENFLTGIMVTSNNNTLIGNNASNNGIGIFLSNSSKNKLINNNANYNGGCGGKFGGIFLSYSNNNTLINNNASSNAGCKGNGMGIFLEYSNNNTLSGNRANLNFNYGIYLYNSKNNTLIGNEANSNTGLSCPCNSGTGPGTGIRLVSSSNNTLSGNNVSNQEYVSAEHGYNLGGIGIDLYLSSNNKIYNNYINNIDNDAFNNSYYTEMRGSNIWNTTRIPGPNVVGGQYLGGNYWANPNGTGFSQTCTDANVDGICDSPYVLDANNTDYRPLASIPIISFINPTPVNGAFLAQNYANVNTTVSNALTAFIDWNHSLVGWLRFNNESGESPSFFRDWSSWGNNGTCSGTNCPASTSEKFGNALNFDGVNDYVDVGNKTSLNITGPISIEAWINPAVVQEKCFDGVSGNYGVMSKVNAPTNSVNWSWQLRYGAPGGCYLGFNFNGNPEGGKWVTVKQNLTPSQWYHVVGTFNGTDINSYLNGNLTDTNKISAIKGYNNRLLIGNDGWSDLFNGKIDEVHIHNRALSPDEIKASYNAGIYRLYNNFTGQPVGVYNYRAYAQNLQGNVNQTEKRTLTLVSSNGITVTSPNGGENWQAGTTKTIKWNYTGSPGSRVKIELLKGTANSTINSNVSIGSSGNGSYSWLINSTQTPGTNYKVRVTSKTNPIYNDTSNNNFTISTPKPSITVNSPNGGENWQAGTTKTIKWNYTGSPGSRVKIELLKGTANSTINSNVSIGSSGNGSYSWLINSTQTPGTNYKVRVTSKTNPIYNDTSNKNFTISAP